MLNRLHIVGIAATFFVWAATTEARAASLPGWSKTCVAPNWITGAPEQVPDMNTNNPFSQFWGFTSRQPGGGWLIQFNLARIAGPLATPAVLKFLFYHECAHAQFNTADEGIADCQGLAAMRRDMRVTKAMIAEITAVYASVGRPFPSGPC